MDHDYFKLVGQHLGKMPMDFLAVDCETNGLDAASPAVLPLEFGWCLVVGGKVADVGSNVIDWYRGETVDARWLDESIERTRYAMESRGHGCRFSREVLGCGLPPREAMAHASSLMASARADGLPVVGHNLHRFDTPILHNAMLSAKVGFMKLEPEEVVDTMILDRGRAQKKPPKPGEFRRDWYGRITHGRGNLAACVAYYGVEGLDPSLAHTAGEDARASALVLLAMGRLSRGEDLVIQGTLFAGAK